MRLGVFGGTFDPPHVGHLIVAQDVCEALELDRLLLMPAATPPHKRERPVSPADVRRAMLEAAIEGDARLEVSDLELRRDGPSYTVDTLTELRREHQGPLFLVMGVDQHRELGSWRRPDEIRRLAEIVVMARGGSEPELGGEAGVRTVEVTRVDVASTGIRARVRAGLPVRYLVPDTVLVIIEGEGLYR